MAGMLAWLACPWTPNGPLEGGGPTFGRHPCYGACYGQAPPPGVWHKKPGQMATTLSLTDEPAHPRPLVRTAVRVAQPAVVMGRVNRVHPHLPVPHLQTDNSFRTCPGPPRNIWASAFGSRGVPALCRPD